MQELTQEQIQEQIEMEKYYKTLAEDLFKKRLEQLRNRGRLSNNPVGTGMKRLFVDAFAENLEKWTEEQIKPRRGVAKMYRPLLVALVEAFGIRKFVLNASATTLEVTINQLLATTEPRSISFISNDIGKTLYYNGYTEAFLKAEDTEGVQVNRIQAGLDDRTMMYQKQNHIKHIMESKFQFQWHKYEGKEIASLGAELLYILVESTDLIEVRHIKNKGSFLEPTQAMLETYRKNADMFSRFIVDRTPTIIPPKPWTGLSKGGYYGIMGQRLHFMRINHIVGRTKVVKSYLNKIRDVDLSQVYEAVNSIQATAYRINQDVYSIIEAIFDQGGELAGIPRFEPETEPQMAVKESKKDFIKKRWLPWLEREQERRGRAIRGMKRFNYAKDFKNRDKIYCPCNIDFRGRIYPVPSFNHQGDDFMKALIEYSDPVPLKDNKDIELLWWQGANLWGNDKVSHAEQVEWVKSNHWKILDSAKAPLEYLWWTEADEPLQFLAWCMEYKRAEEHKESTGEYTNFICRIVIAYDGTCSGLQHYSAILRDPVGGSAVNLIDHERPADIYQQVADKVKAVVEQDAIHGTLDEVTKEETGGGQRVHFGSRTLATAWLSYGITRKVVKRNVMTLAYGSGQYGFQEQLYNDITKKAPEFKRIQKPCAKYLAKIVWQQVQDVVVSATEGMKYLKALAGVLTKHGLPVNWWTPLGLPVQQQYLKMETKYIRTRFGESIRIPLYYQEVSPNEDLDANGQKNGIAPNFIHSLDSTHLMMVVNNAGLSNYTTIHDSFGTSLGEARALQRVIREQLYKLYTEHSPIEEFKAYVEAMTGEDLSELQEPTIGNLDLKCILESTFIFH